MQYGRLGEPERVSVRLGFHVGVKSQKTASWLLTGITTTPHRAGQAELHHRGATQVRGPQIVRDPGQETRHRGKCDAGGTWSSQSGLDCHS